MNKQLLEEEIAIQPLEKRVSLTRKQRNIGAILKIFLSTFENLH